MYYAVIGILAVAVMLIENQDILLNKNGDISAPSWKVYRRFLIAALVFYLSDILWGFFESLKIPAILFADTSVYFIIMAFGILTWMSFVVTYLNEKNTFELFIQIFGWIIAGAVAILSVVNIFVPVLFKVDEACVYYDLPGRDMILLAQILLLVLISAYAFISVFKNDTGNKRQRYVTIAHFGLIMGFFLLGQMFYPYLPLYAMAYMLGTCLLRAFVIREEKEELRVALEEAEKVKELKHSISSLLDNMPALSFYKDAWTGVYMACNQAFAEYAHKDDPEGVIGLTDAQIFDKETAEHFVNDDRLALSMDDPYVFYEDVHDAEGNQRQFQTTKLKFIDASGKLCLLGMCQDVTDMIAIQRENAKTKEAYKKAKTNSIIFSHIAQTLAHSYENLFYVNVETGEYTEYHLNKDTGILDEARSGDDFFESAQREVNTLVYPDDREAFSKAVDKATLLENLDKHKSFVMTYRLMVNGEPVFVSMKISRMEDDERFIIIGVTDMDDEMKQRQAAEKAKEEHIAYTRLNALAGDFLCVYVVDPKTGRYREFSSTANFKSFDIPEEGPDFYEASQKAGRNVVYHDDQERFLSMFTKEGILSEVERTGTFSLTYRLIINDVPSYVQLRAAMVEETEGQRLIVGINDIDSHVRQEEEYASRLAMAQAKANVDALTGVRNKHSYLDEEERLNRMLAEGLQPSFAIVILDVNDLKKVNDTQGHQAGDEYIRNACKIICDTFKKSPVFRTGGDEFTVVVQGDDYASIEQLIGRMSDHNEKALVSGGVVIACGMSKCENDICVATVFERADQVMYDNKSSLKARKKTN